MINTESEVFVYSGERDDRVPDDVVRVRVDPSISSIPASAFQARKKLAEVELCEGLVEIGERSFGWCDQSITKIIIPSSLRRINDWAFNGSLRTPIRLHDGIESIGRGAFAGCIFTNFRVPTLITVIPNGMLSSCKSMFSAEITHNVKEIECYAFDTCSCLRNVAFPPNAVFGNNIFGEVSAMERSDLYQLFGSIDEMIGELQHRFDRLPVHSLIYYQSYNQGVLQILIAAVNMRSGQRRSLRSKLNPTGNQQDCLGMTPLHILACSSIHDLEVYRFIVEKYPANLITEDRWGATPLLYALWGASPDEIIQLLLESYQSLYPRYMFNWTMMMETMGRCDTPKEKIENLLCVKQMLFPEQLIDWEYLLHQFASSSHYSFSGLLFQERMQYLVLCGMTDRVEALPFKVWRDHVTKMIPSAEFKYFTQSGNLNIISRIQSKVAHFEEEIPKLMEFTTILQLVLWKLKMNESILLERAMQCQKKIKTDVSNIRRQCRITCGADVVIRHVLHYLICTDNEESDFDSDDKPDTYSDDEPDFDSDDESSISV